MSGIFNLGYGQDKSQRHHWMSQALCAQTDPDIFFPEKGGSTAPAMAICKNCTVRAQCLDYALTNDIRGGIYGGMSDNERKDRNRAKRRRRLG